MGSHLHQQRVVHIYKCYLAVLVKVVIKFPFGGHNPFKGAEPLQMRLSHIGYESETWTYQFYQCLNLSGIACTHLNYGGTGIPINAQQGKRHTNMVVKVAFCSNYIIFLPQARRYKFLGCGFAVCTGKGHYRNPELPAVMACHLLQRNQNIPNQNHSLR